MASIILELGTGRTADCPDDIAKTLLAHTVNKTTSRRVKQFFKGVATMILVAGSSAGAAVGVSHYLDSKRPDHEPVAEIAHDIRSSANRLESASNQEKQDLKSQLTETLNTLEEERIESMDAIIALMADNSEIQATLLAVSGESDTMQQSLLIKIEELQKLLDNANSQIKDLSSNPTVSNNNQDESETERLKEQIHQLEAEILKARNAHNALDEVSERMSHSDAESLKASMRRMDIIEAELKALSPGDAQLK